MVDLTQIDCPPEYQRLNTPTLIQLNDTNLGRTILIGAFIQITMNPFYNHCIQFIKTKFLSLGIQESSESQALFSVPDISTFVAYCKNMQFYNFLDTFGKALVKSNNIHDNLSEIQHLSRDLNIKLVIYEGANYVSEGVCYEFPNPAVISIISQKANDEFEFPYLFTTEQALQPLFSSDSEEKNRKTKIKLNDFAWALLDLTDDAPIRKELKDWVTLQLRNSNFGGRENMLVRKLLRAKVRMGEIPQLRTATMKLDLLKTSQSYVTKMPEMFKRFAPLPEDNLLGESGKMDEDDDEDQSDDEPEGDVKKIEDVPTQKFHCDECRERPNPEGLYECKCQLSQQCMYRSYEENTCINCKKKLTANDRAKFSAYFG